MIEQLTDLTADVELLLRGVVLVVGIAMTVATWLKTKSSVATVGALMLAVVVYWGVNNIAFLEQKVGEDLEGAIAADLEVSIVDV